MVELPNFDTVTLNDLAVWEEMKKELSKLKANEMLLRKRLVRGFFHDFKEGTNKLELANSYALKFTHVVNREIDLPAFNALREELIARGVKVDDIIQYKPSLVISEYRQLTEEQRSFFDQTLIVKDGSPQLEIVKVKSKSGD